MWMLPNLDLKQGISYLERERGRKRERDKEIEGIDREIEGWNRMIDGRDKKTKRKLDGETEIQIDRQRDRETKRQRDKETELTIKIPSKAS
jgi:hypothetical protein